MNQGQGVAFDDPSAGAPQLEPGSYFFQLLRLEQGEDFGNGPTVKWIFAVADATGPILDQDGQPYEFFALSSQKMGPKSKARDWCAALLNREIRDGEAGAEIARAIVGKRAKALLGLTDRGFARIQQLLPITQPPTGPRRPGARPQPIGATAMDAG